MVAAQARFNPSTTETRVSKRGKNILVVAVQLPGCLSAELPALAQRPVTAETSYRSDPLSVVLEAGFVALTNNPPSQSDQITLGSESALTFATMICYSCTHA